MYRNCRKGVESFYNLECFWYARYFLFFHAGSFLLLSSAHLLQERNERHEAIVIFRFTQFLHQTLGLLLGEGLLSLLGLTSNFLNSSEGWVQVAGTDEVTGIEGINLAISLEVIDIKGKVDGIDFLLLESKFS